VNPKAKLILLVEDNPDDAELTILALQEGGVFNDVVWVKDGVEALDFLFCSGAYASRDPNELPQLVLLDLKMPRMDGIEVLRRIRSEPSTRPLPVVILTTSAEESDRLNGYLTGANSYIRKPVDFEQFARAIQQLKLYWLVLNESPLPSA
jgi:two-component system response regulator